MIRGIDISKWQSPTPPLDGLSFVVIKASQGRSADPMYATHYAACRKAGVITMAYCYGIDAAVVPVADQVATFLAVAADADFLWLDQEAAGFSDAEAQDFIDAVRVVRPCGLYHSASGFGGVNADAKWVADWRDASETAGYPRTADGSKEFPGWDLWQYDGGGADGIDNDYANPDRPLAGLLRLGYVTQLDYDDAVDALKDVQGQLVLCQLAHDAALSELGKARMEIDTLQAQLAAAPAIERDRIAAAEAERIRAL